MAPNKEYKKQHANIDIKTMRYSLTFLSDEDTGLENAEKIKIKNNGIIDKSKKP